MRLMCRVAYMQPRSVFTHGLMQLSKAIRAETRQLVLSLLSHPSPYTAFMQSPFPRSVTSCTLLPVTAGLVVRIFCLLFIFNEGFLPPLCRGHKRCFECRRRKSRRPFINRFETPTRKNLMPIAKKDSR